MARGVPTGARPGGRGLTLATGALFVIPSAIVLAAALGSLPANEACEVQAPQSSSEDITSTSKRTCGEAWEDLRSGLRRIRSGEEPDRGHLNALAAQLEALCARDDAVRATRHLTSLSPKEAYTAEVAFRGVDATLDAYGSSSGGGSASGSKAAVRALELMTSDLDLLADPLPAAYVRRVLAELYLNQGTSGDLSSAAALAERALETYERVGFYDQEVEALEVLARVHLASAELFSARREASHGLEISRRIDDCLYESRCLRVLVRVADRTGASLDRERLLRQWGRLGARSDIEEWWAWMRQTVSWHIDEDHPKQALAFLQDAMTRRRETSGIDPLISPSLRRQARSLEAMILIRAGEFERASALLEEGITYNDRSRLLRAHLNLRKLSGVSDKEAKPLLAELSVLLAEDWVAALPPELRDEGDIYKGEYHLRDGQPELARAALERAVARALERERGLAQSVNLEETSSIGGEALGLHAVQLLARVYLELDLPLLAARISEEMQARTLRQKVRNLEESNLLDWAANNELGLVTWVIGPDEGVAIWIGPDGERGARIIPYGRRAVQRAVGRLRQALRDERKGDSESFGEELARELIPSELLKNLSTCRGESLLLLAHGPLEPLPMGALRVPAQGSFGGALLAEAATLRVLPGLPAARPGDALAGNPNWVLAGAPVDAKGHTRLPAALEELEEIGERRSCDLLSGAEMSRAAMLSAIEDDACLHIATHVEWIDTSFGPSPALELARGELLSVEDLPARLGPRELVVLAGCESAGGRVLDGEGMLGFTRAFLRSGTRGVVATLWPVGDETAKEFGVALHESLLAENSPSTAVRDAAQKLREEGVADWAAFQLLGRD